MHLRKLRPREGADLHQLRTLIEGRGWRSAMPDAFPDLILLRLARDFRCVERSLVDDSTRADSASSLAAAMYVVMNLMMLHPARSAELQGMDVSELGMVRSLQSYQWALEREVVARIVGLSAADQSNTFLERFWQDARN